MIPTLGVLHGAGPAERADADRQCRPPVRPAAANTADRFAIRREQVCYSESQLGGQDIGTEERWGSKAVLGRKLSFPATGCSRAGASRAWPSPERWPPPKTPATSAGTDWQAPRRGRSPRWRWRWASTRRR